jgi:hypothetical protein
VIDTVIPPPPWRWRLEDHMFEASLSYIMRPFLKKTRTGDVAVVECLCETSKALGLTLALQNNNKNPKHNNYKKTTKSMFLTIDTRYFLVVSPARRSVPLHTEQPGPFSLVCNFAYLCALGGPSLLWKRIVRLLLGIIDKRKASMSVHSLLVFGSLNKQKKALF